MRANETYYRGKPLTSAVVIEPYTSVRSAWADMLRGQVDVLYDVGVDALDSMESSNEATVFTFQRGYVFMLLLNTRRPSLSDPEVRRRLNAAIDRTALITDVFQRPRDAAEGPVWPQHWAYDRDLPRFRFTSLGRGERPRRRKLTCLFFDPSLERLALARSTTTCRPRWIDWCLELVPATRHCRLRTGDFDAVLSDYLVGPNLVRPYSSGIRVRRTTSANTATSAVDAGLDAIRHAASDAEYQSWCRGITARDRRRPAGRFSRVARTGPRGQPAIRCSGATAHRYAARAAPLAPGRGDGRGRELKAHGQEDPPHRDALRAAARRRGRRAAARVRLRLDPLAPARHPRFDRHRQPERRDARRRRNPPLRRHQRRAAEGARRRPAGHRPRDSGSRTGS